MSYFPHHQGNAMNENQPESESLLDDADYQLLRCDSFLTRVGSNNFASLIETTPSNAESEELRQQEQQQSQPQQQPPQQPPQQHESSIMQFSNEPVLSAILSGELHLYQTECWFNMENGLLENPVESCHVQPEAPVGPCDGNSSASVTPDSSPNCQVPSLQIWPGQYDFGISVPFGNKDRNKWCFSTAQNKLYLLNNIAVPINVKVLQWFDAFITITPVFKDSRNRVEPVMPCFNCKEKVKNGGSSAFDHMVMVEGQECHYKNVNGRFVVSVPLHPPPPGEVVSTLLLKLTCLTSCVGGPNRRQFCLVFTLHDSSGSVVGRQILDLKCCKCPSRDMMNEDKATMKRQHPAQPNNDFHPLEHVQALKRAAPVATTDAKKKKRFNIKLEPGMENRYRNVTVPVEYVGKVKAYVNSLIAEEYIRRNQPNLLLFSEDEL